MPKAKTNIVYCTARARDGKGGVYELGQKVECDSKEKAAVLLASNRFTEDPEVAEKAVAKAKAAAKAVAVDKSKDDEIAKLKKDLATAKKK